MKTMIIALLLASIVLARADSVTITLKTGQVYENVNVVSETKDFITIELPDGKQKNFNKRSIQSTHYGM